MESRTLSWPTVTSPSLPLPVPAFYRTAKMTWILVSGFSQLMLSCLLSVHPDRSLCLQQLLQAAGLRLESFSFFLSNYVFIGFLCNMLLWLFTVQAIALCCNCLFVSCNPGESRGFVSLVQCCTLYALCLARGFLPSDTY